MNFFNQLMTTAKPYSLELLALVFGHGQQRNAVWLGQGQQLVAVGFGSRQ